MLASRLLHGKSVGAWNFGPKQSVSVRDIIAALPGVSHGVIELEDNPPVEDLCLRLDSSKTTTGLGWENKLNWRDSVNWTVEDYRFLHEFPERMAHRIKRRLKDYSDFWEVLN